MDTKEYISSGILEEYSLGSVSPQEKQEVECMAHIYPEIQEALDEMLLSVESISLAEKKKPPEELKSKIMGAIQDTEQENPDQYTEQQNQKEVKVVDMKQNNDSGKVGKSYSSVISIAALLAIIFAGGLYFYMELQDKNEAITNLQNDKTELSKKAKNVSEKVDQLNSKNDKMNDRLAMIQHKDTRKVMLQGTDNQKNGLVTVYWNKKTEKVFLNVNNLENPPTDKQYQLWALDKNGQPIDMGTFQLDEKTQKDVKLISKTPEAQAFAITLEPKGGSKKPTLEQMMVQGKV